VHGVGKKIFDLSFTLGGILKTPRYAGTEFFWQSAESEKKFFLPFQKPLK
jgi:hypothetical protein